MSTRSGNRPQPSLKACPPSIGFLACGIGLALTLVGILNQNDAEFPSGRAPVIACGGFFFLIGLQIIRVTVLGQKTVSWVTSVIGSLACSLFASAFFWSALNEGTVFRDKAGHSSLNQTTGRVVSLYVAVVLCAVAVGFAVKAVKQFKKRKVREL